MWILVNVNSRLNIYWESLYYFIEKMIIDYFLVKQFYISQGLTKTFFRILSMLAMQDDNMLFVDTGFYSRLWKIYGHVKRN